MSLLRLGRPFPESRKAARANIENIRASVHKYPCKSAGPLDFQGAASLKV